MIHIFDHTKTHVIHRIAMFGLRNRAAKSFRSRNRNFLSWVEDCAHPGWNQFLKITTQTTNTKNTVLDFRMLTKSGKEANFEVACKQRLVWQVARQIMRIKQDGAWERRIVRFETGTNEAHELDGQKTNFGRAVFY